MKQQSNLLKWLMSFTGLLCIAAPWCGVQTVAEEQTNAEKGPVAITKHPPVNIIGDKSRVEIAVDRESDGSAPRANQSDRTLGITRGVCVVLGDTKAAIALAQK